MLLLLFRLMLRRLHRPEDIHSRWLGPPMCLLLLSLPRSCHMTRALKECLCQLWLGLCLTADLPSLRRRVWHSMWTSSASCALLQHAPLSLCHVCTFACACRAQRLLSNFLPLLVQYAAHRLVPPQGCSSKDPFSFMSCLPYPRRGVR
jgi:hypothetical protein